MDFRNRTARLRLALTCAALASLLTTSLAVAQSAPMPDGSTAAARAVNVPITPAAEGPLIEVHAPNAGLAGNVTFRGLAVDCSTGLPADRVAVYDGRIDEGSYLADVTMDMVAGLEGACMGKSGMAPIGFTLIFDTRNLADGVHTLMFVADYPDGMSDATVAQIFVENVLPYEPSDDRSSGSD